MDTASGGQFEAAILDLDGVITRTARVHARAWKRMFDDYLRRRSEGSGERLPPFSIEEDYPKYVDGKPRYEGAQAFLESRGIDLPWGDPSDEPGKETICGLGNQKNALFHQFLKDGVEVFDDAVRAIRRWKESGVKTAVVSSSKNCRRIVEAAGIESLFDARVDGVEAERDRLPGKPQADVFLRAAEKLGVKPEHAAVFEDAIAGVEAGRKGRFGLVVGVARRGQAEQLRQSGADLVISSFDELSQSGANTDPSPHRPPSALDRFDQLRLRFAGKRLAVFLDYDGTLTPIVSRPEDATLDEPMRRTVNRLSELTAVAIISGRDLADVEKMVGLPGLVYAGSHGFDIRAPAIRRVHEGGQAALPELDEAEQALARELAEIEGVRVDRKRFAVAVHYRNVAAPAHQKVRGAVERVARRHPQLRMRGGKMIVELQPNIDWHKGKAVLWLLDVLGLNTEQVVPLYIGDDLTDEDVFAELQDRGVGVVVGDETLPSRASYWLADPGEVRQFLAALIEMLEGRET